MYPYNLPIISSLIKYKQACVVKIVSCTHCRHFYLNSASTDITLFTKLYYYYY